MENIDSGIEVAASVRGDTTYCAAASPFIGGLGEAGTLDA